jgi:hypothetical protein
MRGYQLGQRTAPSVIEHLGADLQQQVGARGGPPHLLFLHKPPADHLCGREPADLWRFYAQSVEVEAAFKNLKADPRLRPIFHQRERRIEAHIFVAFMAYCLQVTLRARLQPLAGGLTPRAVLEKFATLQMLDVHLPTTDGRTPILSRYTQPEPDHQILLQQLKLRLPPQPPPCLSASGKLLP